MDIDRYGRQMSEQTGPTAGAPWAPVEAKTGGPSTGTIVAIVIVLIAAAVGIGALIYTNTASYKAEKACKAYVVDQLTSPSSAKFSDVQFFDIDRPEVTGSVDSENGFGAALRSGFSCQMSNSTGTWTVTTGAVF